MRQLFLSYKSEDCHAVRLVAEWLGYNRIPTWFGEYAILLDDRGTGDIDAAIRNGIDTSSHALIFTNDLYSQSEWCSLEAERLLERLPPENILEVCIPRHAAVHGRFPGLARADRLVFRTRHKVKLAKLEQQMRAKDWLGPEPLRGLQRLRAQRSRLLALPYFRRILDASDWDTVSVDDPLELYFRRDIDGPISLCVWTTLLPYEPKTRRLWSGPMDDRRVFEENIGLTQKFRRDLRGQFGIGFRPLGIHLFHLGDYSHYAMSYELSGADIDGTVGPLVCRRYVIRAEPVEGPGMAELALMFRTPGDLHRLHRLAPLFEYTAATLYATMDRRPPGSPGSGAPFFQHPPPQAIFGDVPTRDGGGCLLAPLAALLGFA